MCFISTECKCSPVFPVQVFLTVRFDLSWISLSSIYGAQHKGSVYDVEHTTCYLDKSVVSRSNPYKNRLKDRLIIMCK